MERRDEEREELERRAYDALRRAEDLEPRLPGRVYLRVWFYPAFEARRSWLLYGPQSTEVVPSGAVLRRVTWNSVLDLGRLWDPLKGIRFGFHSTPTLRVEDCALSDETRYRLQSHLSPENAPAIPLVQQNLVCLDGVRIGVEVRGTAHEIDAEWHVLGTTPAWQALDEWMFGLIKVLDQLIESPGP